MRAKVLKEQKKTMVKPLFDPKSYKVIKVEGPRVTAEHRGEVLVRNMALLKLVKVFLETLISKLRVERWNLEDINYDDDFELIN